jgi:CheY-like chemotaxis protein
VVDDEPDMRFLFRYFLEIAGHEVFEANNGGAALQSVHKSPPDLVITDIMMPVMGGLELIGRLRSDPATAAIPILVVSGDTELAVAADAALAKPVWPHELVKTAGALLGKEWPGLDGLTTALPGPDLALGSGV